MGENGQRSANSYTDFMVWAAQHARQSGYSVIPIHGDSASDRAKVAAVNWKLYQARHPSEADINRWFTVEGHRGLGIVTGMVSNLVVLDFDDARLAQRFAMQYPQLTETYTVRSAGRGLPHYYYRLPLGTRIPTQKGQGVDLLSDGCYVIAPPTVIEGQAYRALRGGIPKTLTNAEIGLILHFLESQRVHVGESAKKPQNRVVAADGVDHAEGVMGEQAGRYTPDALVALYRHLAPLMGRNEALFYVSIRARDNGWQRQAVTDVLARVHVEQPAVGGQLEETAAQRLREGQRTIASAFSRPPKKTNVQKQTNVKLPTSARECLLNMGQTCTLRVLEGLHLRGLAPGSLFTEREARDMLEGVVGRYSILKALDAQTGTGKAIFAVVNPSPRPPTPTNVAAETHPIPNNKCFIVNASKSDKNGRGRPAKQYRLPTIAELCTLLGVEARGSDPIESGDLCSAKGYRQAIHRQFLKRRPGRYSRVWLARRLGVSVRTFQRYNVQMAVGVRPMYHETLVTWANLDVIPDDFAPEGAFLEDRRGGRYPVNRGVAAKLLARDRYLVYKRRDVNYYWVGEMPPIASIGLGIRPDWVEIEAREQKKRTYVLDNMRNPVVISASKTTVDAPKSTSAGHDEASDTLSGRYSPSGHYMSSKHYKPKRKSYYRQPLADTRQEMVALRAYQLVGALAAQSAMSRSLSKAMARRLVEQYGWRLVADALKILGARRNVRHPAGFLVTVVRSEARWR